MRRAIFALTAVLVIIFLMEPLAQVIVVDANPTWGKPATPIPPITDPPQIIIYSPSATEYNNSVPLSLAIILPNSWGPEKDGLVAGRNSLRSITCIIDGQFLFTLWKGTPWGSLGITYYLPRVTQFSAVMNISKGQHNLMINTLAVSEYVTEGIIPFADKEYFISANQTVTFSVNNGSDGTWSPTIGEISSSYAPLGQQPAPISTSIPTPDPTQSVSPSPTMTPTVPEFSWLMILPLFIFTISIALIARLKKVGE